MNEAGETHRNDVYEVGWICALRTELAVARAMLDEDLGIAQFNEVGDPNTYALGRIHQHNVVIACLPAGIDGTNAATTVAQNMLRTFPQIRIGLLVGIGGGIPNQAKGVDIRLGDVVVSQPDGEYGGVIQYAKGKLQEDSDNRGHRFVRKGSLNKPPIFILKALNMLRAEHEIEDSKISMFLQDMLSRKPKMRKTGYTFPGFDQDHLFDSAEIEMQTANKGENTSSKHTKIIRTPRDNEEPLIHYGNIASGDLVIKHAGMRDALRDEFGAMCVEMEAAGLMDTFPCIVIRGICDYADSFKNDIWHPYAAATAAAYAKELLLYVTPQQIHQSPAAQQVVDSKTHELLAQNIAVQERTLDHQHRAAEELKIQHEKERALQCHQSFACVYEEYKDNNPDRAPGTCEWVLNHHQFKAWQQSKHVDLLWISADPGCGKSVLAKTLVDRELRQTGGTICYFFFKDNIQQDSVRIALKALLHQLFSQQPQLLKHAMSVWETKGGKAVYEVNEMWRMFVDATTDPTGGLTYCVLDALDECREDDRRTLITIVSDHYRQQSSHISESRLKFLFTSRPYTNVERWFKPVVAEIPQIRLRGEDENDHIHQEINLVIDQQVDQLSNDFLLSSANREWLLQRLVRMEHRTYLWLHLAMDEIRRAYENSFNPDNVRIESVPISVNDAYERILKKINTEAKQNARKVLTIILGAQRPLTIGEMALALVASSAYDTGIPSTQLPNIVRLEEQIRQWCGLFVFINHSKLFLIHQTAKEFLLTDGLSVSRDPSIWKSSLAMPEVDKELARLCIQHLLIVQKADISPDDRKIERDDLGSQALKIQTPTQAEKRDFFAYCARNWALHLDDQCVAEDYKLLNRVLSLCDAKSELFTDWFPILWRELNTRTYRERPHVLEQHLFALTGHSALLTELLKRQGFDVDARDSTGSTALICASERGNESAVKLLLDAKADLNAQGGIFGSPLHAASANGHEKVVQILLDRKADVNLPRYSNKYRSIWNGQAPLSIAAAESQVGVVKLLLSQTNILVNVKGEFGRTALSLAVSLGEMKIIELLLENKDVDVNCTDKFGCSPLMKASEIGHLETVKLLLQQRGINANKRDDDGQTPLSIGALSGNMEMMKILLQHDSIDVNCRDKDGRSCLSQASERGQVAIVEMLLAHPAIDVESADISGQTPSSWASKHGHKAVLKLLEEHRAHHLPEQNSTKSQLRYPAKSVEQEEYGVSQNVFSDLELDSIIDKLLQLSTNPNRKTSLMQLQHGEIRFLCVKAREVFLKQPTLLDLTAPITICGDMRASYVSLLDIFRLCGYPPETKYLFLGNYVDRGPQSLETICLLLAFKIKYKDKFFLLRGSHECASINRIYGFYDECKRRYNLQLWKVFADCFNCMPFAAMIDEKIFAVHSGISPELHSMDQIRYVIRPTDVDSSITGWSDSDRGVSFAFGPDVVSQFVQEHDIDLVCCSNRVVEGGYEFFSDRNLVTLFSQPDYHGEFNNLGAVMEVDENLCCRFKVIKPVP